LIGNVISGIASATWLSFMMFFLKMHSDASKVENMGVLVMANNSGMLLGFVVASISYSQIAMTGLCLLSTLAGAAAFIMA
ncbi:hypothetical protein, partial [Desulfocurvus sp. DL9XJH121]